MAVLVTRPEPGCAATCRLLTARGIAAVAAPLLAIERTRVPAPATRPQAVLVTSANALPALAPLPGVRLFAVGDATAAAAARLGWAPTASAAGDAADLLALCRAALDPDAGPLLLLAGAGQGLGLAAALRAFGFGVTIAVAYRQRPVAAFPAAAGVVLAAGGCEAALFFSSSAAARFASLLPASLGPALAGVTALAISEATAAPLRRLGWRDLRCARRPNSADLLALL